MKSLISFFCLTLYFTFSNAQTIEKIFESEVFNVTDVTPTVDGGYLVAGYTHDTPGILIVKTDVNLVTQWSKKVTNPYFAPFNLYSVKAEESNDGGYLLFTTAVNRAYVIKFSAVGNLIWSIEQTLPDYAYNNSCRIEELPSGDIILFRSVYSSMCLARFNSSGTLLWSKSVHKNGEGKNPAFDFYCMPDESVVASAKCGIDNSFARLDNAGNLIWGKVSKMGTTYNQARAITKMDNGNLLTGGYRQEGAGAIIAYYMEVDASNGTVLWQKEIDNGFIVEKAKAVGSNRYLLVGYFDNNTESAYLIDSVGNVLKSINLFNPLYTYSAIQPSLKQIGSDLYLIYPIKNGPQVSCVFIKTDTNLAHPCISNENSVFAYSPIVSIVEEDSLVVENIGIYNNYLAVVENTSVNVQALEICEILSQDKAILKETDSFHVFPNPISENNSLTIEIKNSYSNQVRISDLTGKIIFSNTFNSNRFEISMTALSGGMYIVNVTNEAGNTFTKKIIKE